MRRIILLLLLCLLPQNVHAFGAVSFLGQNGEHEKVTRIALKGLGIGPGTMDELAGKQGSLAAVGAPDRPDRGLMDRHHVHCDGGDHLDVPGYPQSRAQADRKINDCREFIFEQLSEAVRIAGGIVDARGRVRTEEIPTFVSCLYDGRLGRAKCSALGALGLAFHASQDFYSHSNWVDIPAKGPISAENPPGLGQEGMAATINPRIRAPLPEGLISGCFEGKPERAFCEYGDKLNRVRHRVLNKDVGKLSVRTGKAGRGDSIRGRVNENFRRAVEAAVADTRDKWLYFEEQVISTYGQERGSKIICAMKNDDEDACK